MICIFPDPYPDELLYSVCARYAVLMDYPNRVTATRDFFGDSVTSAVVDLPNRIGHLLCALPLGHLYSANEIIYQHTHFPFYAPFLPQGRASRVLDVMRDEGDNRVAERIGISADRLKMPIRLRFCPSCVKQDREKVGETYWHRVHQLPGVEVCPHHAVFLEESKTLWRNPKNPSEAITAEQSVFLNPPRTLDTSEHTHRIQLNIASYALWLLGWSAESVDAETLRLRYHNLLLTQGLAYYSGEVRTAALVRKLLDYYPAWLLARLGCEIRNPYSNWVLRLLHKHKAGVAQHPIRHILFLILIDRPVEEVLNSFVEFKPFGDRPWPCLNHASDHYSELRVSSCRISDGEKKNKGKPIGTFGCSCGFVYTRSGPDRSESDRFKWSSIQSYGTEWEGLLKRLWEDASLTLHQIAQMLGVNDLTAKRRAISLGLVFPRPTPGSLRGSGEILDRYKIRRKSTWELKKTSREKFLSLLKENPWVSRSVLITLAPHLIDWLRRWDKSWLETRLPPARKRPYRKAVINWGEQDPILSEAVRNAVSQIHSVAIPRRVSITAIIRLVGRRAWIEKSLDKLPLTATALATRLESYEDYAVRRIAWAVDSFRKEGVTPTRAMLIYRAGIRGLLVSNSERITVELDSALANLPSASKVDRTEKRYLKA